jgi:hypothetical protein
LNGEEEANAECRIQNEELRKGTGSPEPLDLVKSIQMQKSERGGEVKKTKPVPFLNSSF